MGIKFTVRIRRRSREKTLLRRFWYLFLSLFVFLSTMKNYNMIWTRAIAYKLNTAKKRTYLERVMYLERYYEFVCLQAQGNSLLYCNI